MSSKLDIYCNSLNGIKLDEEDSKLNQMHRILTGNNQQPTDRNTAKGSADTTFYLAKPVNKYISNWVYLRSPDPSDPTTDDGALVVPANGIIDILNFKSGANGKSFNDRFNGYLPNKLNFLLDTQNITNPQFIYIEFKDAAGNNIWNINGNLGTANTGHWLTDNPTPIFPTSQAATANERKLKFDFGAAAPAIVQFWGDLQLDGTSLDVVSIP